MLKKLLDYFRGDKDAIKDYVDSISCPYHQVKSEMKRLKKYCNNNFMNN